MSRLTGRHTGIRTTSLADDCQSLMQELDDLEALCAQVLADHSHQQEEEEEQQQQQQQQQEQTPATELREFLIGAGLADRGESLDQAMQRLEDMTTEALQQPPATSSNTQG